MTYREHGAWVVKAHLQKETEGRIISVRYTAPSFACNLEALKTDAASDGLGKAGLASRHAARGHKEAVTYWVTVGGSQWLDATNPLSWDYSRGMLGD